MKTRSKTAFTLVEIMIVIAIIMLLASVAIPSYIRSRKRTQATRILEDLRLLDNAVENYAIDTGKGPGNHPSFADLQNYIKTETALYSGSGTDLLGNNYGPFTVDSLPRVNPSTLAILSDVIDASFWSPYQ